MYFTPFGRSQILRGGVSLHGLKSDEHMQYLGPLMDEEPHLRQGRSKLGWS